MNMRYKICNVRDNQFIARLSVLALYHEQINIAVVPREADKHVQMVTCSWPGVPWAIIRFNNYHKLI